MLKRFYISLIVLFFFNTVSVLSKPINKIDIKGNQRITDETILILGGIDTKALYNDQKLNDVIKKLYDTNFFEDINLKLSENGLLEIIVIENPIIEDLQIEGVKSRLVRETLYESIKLKSRSSFTENQLLKDINIINNILKMNGYYFSNIKPSFVKNDELNSVRIVLNIDLGKKAKIKKITFIGDKKIKDKQLLEVIASEEHKFWKFLSNKVFLNESTINLDVRLLENFYKNLGYKNVNVVNSFSEFDERGFFNLVFNINSGRKFFFNNFQLNLPDGYNPSDFEKMNRIFDKLSNKVFSLDKLNLILTEIDKIASSRLYEFIDAEVTESYVDNKINFTFNVIDTEKAYVERINILGNFQTLEEVIRNKLVVDEGDPLNTLLYNKSLDNIKSLGIFKNVDGRIYDGINENKKILDITVEEQPTGEITLAAGVGTSGSTIGGGIKEKNFLGKGINLNTNLEISEDSVKGQFIYSKPNFAYSDNTLFTSLKATTSDYLSDFGYKISETGFSIGTEFEQYENFFLSPELSFSIEDLETNNNASTQLKKQEGTYEDFYFNYGLNYDLRNSNYLPTSGNKTSFYQEIPVVSGNTEFSNTIIFTQYKELRKISGMTGKASFYFKNVNTIDKNSDVRISKRVQAPYSRLRGFEKGKIGPVDNSDFIGGNYVSILNLSTNLPDIFKTIENLDFSYFIDIANVWGVDYDDSIDNGSKIRSSTGVAMDVLTPIGPLSFSLTQPVTKLNTDKTETFRFNLGTTF